MRDDSGAGRASDAELAEIIYLLRFKRWLTESDLKFLLAWSEGDYLTSALAIIGWLKGSRQRPTAWRTSVPRAYK